MLPELTEPIAGRFLKSGILVILTLSYLIHYRDIQQAHRGLSLLALDDANQAVVQIAIDESVRVSA